MTTAPNNYDDVFSEANIPQTGFFKFEKIGDQIAGIFIRKELVEPRDIYPAQCIYVLQAADGSTVKVGLSINKKRAIEQADAARPGDILGFKRGEDFKRKDAPKGQAPAKTITAFVKRVALVEAEAFE